MGTERRPRPTRLDLDPGSDSLWSPEHDWILQFDQLLSPRRKTWRRPVATTPRGSATPTLDRRRGMKIFINHGKCLLLGLMPE